MADCAPHMIRYWIQEKGLDEAFKSYYPDLAKRDHIINQALAMREMAEKALLARVDELEAAAEPCAQCGEWECGCTGKEGGK